MIKGRFYRKVYFFANKNRSEAHMQKSEQLSEKV